MLFLFLHLASSITDALGLIGSVIVLELAREIRAWQRGKRLQNVERDVLFVASQQPAPRKPRTKPADPLPPVHGPN